MPGWRILLWVVLVLASLIFLWLVRGILLPFLVAIILAAILEPAVRKLRMRGVSRRAAVYIVMGAFLAFAVGAGVLVAPSVGRQVSSLTTKAQDLTRSFAQSSENDNFFLRWNPATQTQQPNAPASQLDRLLAQYGGTLERLGIPSTRRGLIDRYVDRNRPQIAKFVQGFFDSFFGVLTNLASQILFIFLVPLVVALILLDMDNFRRRSPRWIPPAIRKSTIALMGEITDVFFKYLRGISTVVILYTLAQTALMLAMGVPYAILLGVLFGALYLIPYIGNIISAVTLFSVIGFSDVSGNLVFSLANPWGYAFLVTMLYLAIGFTFDHFLYPQMVGNSVGLNPVVSLFVIFCGEALFGLPGMIIAFPLAGSIKVILDRLIRVTSVSQEGLHLPSVPLRHRRNATT
jgi:predicted PurR-regulated permease PerM